MSFVPVTPIGRAAAAALLWRHRDRRCLTAVTKATFELVPEGHMTPLDPVPIAFGEHDDPYGLGLACAGDLAPYLHEVDVTVTGHIELPPRFPSNELHVEVELARGREILLDRQLVLDGASRVGPEQRHVHVQGTGPLSRNWPARAELLHGHDPTRLLPPDMDIPEDLDWSFFQSAPAEQRAARVVGDEWLVLGGFFARRPRLRTLLPGARGLARLYRRSAPEPREGEGIEMHIDMLQIDLDTMSCSIVWRGHTDIGELDPPSLHLVAGVEMPGETLAWDDPFQGAPERISLPWEAASVELGETVLLDTGAR